MCKDHQLVYSQLHGQLPSSSWSGLSPRHTLGQQLLDVPVTGMGRLVEGSAGTSSQQRRPCLGSWEQLGSGL